MNTLTKITEIAESLVAFLEPYCSQIAIAGSIRRGKPNPKDIEIVFIAKHLEFQTMLFGPPTVYPATDDAFAVLIQSGILALDTAIKRNGPKHKRFIHQTSGVVIDCFRAEADNWGLILALRTGPGDFNELLVTSQEAGGCMPIGLWMKDGYLWRGAQKVSTPTETGFFSALGVPAWLPHERTAEQLRAWCQQQRGVGNAPHVANPQHISRPEDAL